MTKAIEQAARRTSVIASTAAERIAQLTREVEWYKAALDEKSAWARRVEKELAAARVHLAIGYGLAIVLAIVCVAILCST